MSGQGAGSRGSWERVKEGPSTERVSEVEGYTPTTEEVRQAVAAGYRHWGNVGRTGTEGFDRWLASERARIWDEGYCDGSVDFAWEAVNPYRKGGDA